MASRIDMLLDQEMQEYYQQVDQLYAYANIAGREFNHEVLDRIWNQRQKRTFW